MKMRKIDPFTLKSLGMGPSMNAVDTVNVQRLVYRAMGSQHKCGIFNISEQNDFAKEI